MLFLRIGMLLLLFQVYGLVFLRVSSPFTSSLSHPIPPGREDDEDEGEVIECGISSRSNNHSTLLALIVVSLSIFKLTLFTSLLLSKVSNKSEKIPIPPSQPPPPSLASEIPSRRNVLIPKNRLFMERIFCFGFLKSVIPTLSASIDKLIHLIFPEDPRPFANFNSMASSSAD